MRATAPTPLSDASENRELSKQMSQGSRRIDAEHIKRRCVIHHEISERQANMSSMLAFHATHIAPCVCRFGAGREAMTVINSCVQVWVVEPVNSQV